ncbi:MAG: LysM peptidoglycan-binding domain-containing protein, partial [Bacteroidales bacterium]|nr:LysM peptidoglycan-binding domain-containing protein [Bacteroidales bacterium]
MALTLKQLMLVLGILISTVSLQAQSVEVLRSTRQLNRDGLVYYLHKVEKGQTLYSISKAYGVSMEAIVEANPDADKGLKLGQDLLIPAGVQQEISPAETLVSQGRIYHVVRQGETLYGIARIYNTTVEVLQTLNPSVDADIHAGDRLMVPGMQEDVAPTISSEGPRQYSLYTVRKAETVYGIAERLGVSADDLYLLNPSLHDGLQEGMQIRVPELPTAMDVTGDRPRTHKVRKGEDLQEIAAKYGISTEALIKANPGIETGMSGPARGTELIIPGTDAVKVEEVSPEELPSTMSEALALPEKPIGKVPCTPDDHNLLPTYRAALLLPFYASGGDTITTEQGRARNPSEYPSFRFIQFYEGLMLALDTLEKQGLRLDLKVLDVTEDTVGLGYLLEKEGLRDMDVILGPLYSGSFQVVSRFAQKHGVPLVNPFTNRDEVVLGKPHVFKAYPSEDDRMHGLADFLIETYPGASIFLAGKSGDREQGLRKAFANGLNRSLLAHGLDSGAWHDLTVSAAASNYADKLSQSEPNIFITLSTDQVYVSNLLRRLHALSRSHQFIVVGLPSWEGFSALDPDYLIGLNLHLYANSWVDYSDPESVEFI